jgi:hypothetical protein
MCASSVQHSAIKDIIINITEHSRKSTKTDKRTKKEKRIIPLNHKDKKYKHEDESSRESEYQEIY